MYKNHTENMTKIPYSALITLFPCFIMLLISCIITTPSEGLKMTLVPPHSPESPAYLGNLTISKKIQKLVKLSRGRAKVLSSRLFPTKTINQTSPYGESKLLVRPPVEGINLGSYSGFIYAVKIGIGKFNEVPPYKTYYLSLDTGSSLMWLQCEACRTAGNTCFEQVDPLYQNSLSQTYSPIREVDDLCISAPPNPNPNNLCYYNQQFEDGAKSNGQMAYELFSFESDTPNTIATAMIVFGCGNNQRDFSVDPRGPEKAAGIMGLGRGNEAFPVQLNYDQVGIRFAYCFQDLINLGGGPQPPSYLRFTDDVHDDTTTFQETPFKLVPNNPFYYVGLTNIKIGDTPVNMGTQYYVILDSGGTISFLIRSVYDSLTLTLVNWLNNRIGHPPRMLRTNDLGDPPTFCFEKTASQGFEILPTLHFMLEGAGDFEIMPEQGFVMWQESPQDPEHFCLMIEPHDTLSVIGAFQQANHMMIYDTQQNRLFFKSEDCANKP